MVLPPLPSLLITEDSSYSLADSHRMKKPSLLGRTVRGRFSPVLSCCSSSVGAPFRGAGKGKPLRAVPVRFLRRPDIARPRRAVRRQARIPRDGAFLSSQVPCGGSGGADPGHTREKPVTVYYTADRCPTCAGKRDIRRHYPVHE